MPTLHWLTKDEDVKAASKVPYRLLEEVPELGAGDRSLGNMIVQGDNLEALKSLLPFYAGQVKCIYIDPPYNTKSAFEHYDDNLEHSQWLAMIYPRLELLRELLSEDGLIIASIDDREGAYLTIIMDEIFGRKHRVNIIAVKMSEASGVKMAHTEKRLPKLKEWLLIYDKSNRPKLKIDLIPTGKWNEEYKTVLIGPTDEELNFIRKIINIEKFSETEFLQCQKILDSSKLISISDYFKENEIEKNEQNAWKISNAHRIIQAVGSSSVLNLAKRSIKSKGDISCAISPTGLLYLFKSDFDKDSRQPRIQVIFADDSMLTHPGDFWTDIKTTGGVGQEGGVHFPNGKKPEKLIQKVFGLCTTKGDLILDSFLGSGSSASVAHKMGLKYIGIEMGDQAVTHCVPRMKSVIDGEQGGISQSVNWKGGGGFRFYRLGAAVFDPAGHISPDITFPVLAAHIWFSETGTPWDATNATPFLGIHDGKAYALLYNGILGDKSVSGGNVLTRQTLARIHAKAGDTPLTIYGERSALGAASLAREVITFKQTPYDVKARA